METQNTPENFPGEWLCQSCVDIIFPSIYRDGKEVRALAVVSQRNDLTGEVTAFKQKRECERCHQVAECHKFDADEIANADAVTAALEAGCLPMCHACGDARYMGKEVTVFCKRESQEPVCGCANCCYCGEAKKCVFLVPNGAHVRGDETTVQA